MSLINDMLNDLEQNKDKNNQPKKLNENIQNDHSPEGTPDMPSSNTNQAPVMPPADDEVKITIESVDDNSEATSHEENDLAASTKTESVAFKPSGGEKISIPEGDAQEPEQDQTKHQQPWETGQTQTAKSTDESATKPKINTGTVIEDKKPSQKRLIIWIVIIGVACLALAYLYFWPKSSETSSAQSALGTIATPSAQSTQPAIDIQKDDQPVAANTEENNTPADQPTEATVPAKTDASEATTEDTNHQASTTKENQSSSQSNLAADDSSHEAVEVQPIAVSPLVQAQTSYNQIMGNIDNISSYQAIEQMQQLLSEHPDFKPARTTLAAMLVKYGDSAQALTVLNAGLKQSPADKDMAELTAHILVEQGSVQQALRILKRAQPATIQSDPDYYALMAGLYIQEKDFLQAQNFYQALTRLNPQNGNWWAGLAISSEKLGLQQAAMDAYNRAETVGGLSPALQAYIEQTMQGS